jgi:hypothetical protein
MTCYEEVTSPHSDGAGSFGAEMPAEMVAKAAQLLGMSEGLTPSMPSRAGRGGADRERRGRMGEARLVVVRGTEPVPDHGDSSRHRSTRSPVGRVRQALSIAAAGALAVGIFFAGAAVAGGSQEASTPAAARLARAAAQSWLSGTRFSGPTGGDVGARLDRRGPALGGQLEPAGSWSAPGLLSEQFVVGGHGGAYGLSVVVYKGYLVYPPTPSPLPFVEPAGPPVPETGTWAKTDVASLVDHWAAATFAAAGALRPADLALAGKAQVLDEWRPRSGASLVARVQVPLGSAGGFAAYEARQTLAGAQEAVLGGRQAVVGSAARLKLAEDQAGADDLAAQRAVQAASARDPLSKAAAAAQGTATSAQETVTKAGDALRTAEGQLGAAKSQEAAAQRDLALAQEQPASMSGVYDVAFNRQGNIVAWAPAEYGASG